MTPGEWRQGCGAEGHLVELLHGCADHHRLSLHSAHQEFQILLEGCLVLDEAHGHIVICVTATQLL